MDVKKVGKIKEALMGAADAAKDKAKEIASDVKVPEIKLPDKITDAKIPEKVKSVFDKKDKNGKDENNSSDGSGLKRISTRSAIKTIYFFMAADGQILQSEEEKLFEIGAELDPAFSEHKDEIIQECQGVLNGINGTDNSYEIIQNAAEEAINSSVETEDTFITPKLLTWDLMTVAYSDEHYDENERKLINFIAEKLEVDKAVFLEMESSIQTMMDLEKELKWIKTTDRPYLTIETMVNEIQDRKTVIFDSIKDLIML